MPRKVDKLMQMQPSAQAVDQLMHNCHTYFDEIAQIQKDVTIEDLQTKVLHESQENYRKMARAAVKFELADDEVLPLLKFEMKAEEKDAIMADQARRNGLIVKTEDQFRNDVNSNGLHDKIA